MGSHFRPPLSLLSQRWNSRGLRPPLNTMSQQKQQRVCRLVAWTTAWVLASHAPKTTLAFGNFPKLFGGGTVPQIAFPSFPTNSRSNGVVEAQQCQELLQAIENTNNGKTATPAQQMRILRLVRQLETSSGGSSSSRSSNRISLTDPSIAPLLNGTWYLQYTSPSVVVEELNENENSKDDIDDAAGTWQPVDANEGDSNIETRPFRARGSISAAGVTVDTSNKSVQQIFDIEKRAVINVVALDWGTVQVAGTFRPSPTIANRAIVAFDTVAIAIGGGVVLQFGFVFDILATIRRSRDNGWLETTFVNENMRIGRGNKGTMFVLTRDSNAVKP